MIRVSVVCFLLLSDVSHISWFILYPLTDIEELFTDTMTVISIWLNYILARRYVIYH